MCTFITANLKQWNTLQVTHFNCSSIMATLCVCQHREVEYYPMLQGGGGGGGRVKLTVSTQH